jgi:hypothetical protein
MRARLIVAFATTSSRFRCLLVLISRSGTAYEEVEQPQKRFVQLPLSVATHVEHRAERQWRYRLHCPDCYLRISES